MSVNIQLRLLSFPPPTLALTLPHVLGWYWDLIGECWVLRWSSCCQQGSCPTHQSVYCLCLQPVCIHPLCPINCSVLTLRNFRVSAFSMHAATLQTLVLQSQPSCSNIKSYAVPTDSLKIVGNICLFNAFIHFTHLYCNLKNLDCHDSFAAMIIDCMTVITAWQSWLHDIL